MAEKKRVLVVDDESDFVELIKLRLETAGFEVLSAYSGKEALEKLKSEKIDVVLLDILMPGMDGFAVLKKVRKDYKGMPVYMITAFSNEERFELAKNLGASGFIVKTDDLKKELDNITGALNISGQFKRV